MLAYLRTLNALLAQARGLITHAMNAAEDAGDKKVLRRLKNIGVRLSDEVEDSTRRLAALENSPHDE